MDSTLIWHFGQYVVKSSAWVKKVQYGYIEDQEQVDALEDLPDRPRLFFERMILSRKTLKLVIEAQRRGIDLDMNLHEMLYPKSNG